MLLPIAQREARLDHLFSFALKLVPRFHTSFYRVSSGASSIAVRMAAATAFTAIFFR